jgi:hypothetical protein
MTIHYCVRVYANLSANHTRRDKAGMKSWLDYNRTARPGCALFIDGRIAGPDDSGALSPVAIQAIEAALLQDIKSGVVAHMPIDVLGPQVEMIGGHADHYQGYAPERERHDFEQIVTTAGGNDANA